MYKEKYGENPTGELLHLALRLEQNRIDVESCIAEHFQIDPKDVTKKFLDAFNTILLDVHGRIPDQIQSMKESSIPKQLNTSKRSYTPIYQNAQGAESFGFTKIDLSGLIGKTKVDSSNDALFDEKYAEMIASFGLLKEDTPEGKLVALRAVSILKRHVALILLSNQSSMARQNGDGHAHGIEESQAENDVLVRKDIELVRRRYNQRKIGIGYKLRRKR